MIKIIKKIICRIFGHKKGDKLYVGEVSRDMGYYTLIKDWVRICPRCGIELKYELTIERKELNNDK